jgi:hypothetical protein
MADNRNVATNVLLRMTTSHDNRPEDPLYAGVPVSGTHRAAVGELSRSPASQFGHQLPLVHFPLQTFGGDVVAVMTMPLI